MTKKIGDKKIGGVTSTTETSNVEGADSVTGVGSVKGATAVGGVKGTGSVRGTRLTKTMSAAEREQLFKMVNEEAEKLFGEGVLPQSQKKVVADAVKMAIDSGLLPEDDNADGKKKKK